MRVKQGEGYRIQTTVRQRNLDGTYTLVDPGTIAGTLLFPDQTTAPFTPTKDTVGEYHADIAPATLSQLGHYQWKVVTTGVGAGVQDGALDVVDPFATELLSLADAKQHLNITSTTNDAELETYIAAVTEAIEAYIGPVGRRTITETVSPSSGVLLLSTVPVLSLTSVTPYASAPLTVGSLTVKAASGIVLPGAYTGFYAATYDVIYTAGRASVPASVNTAGRLVLQRLWETQRGPMSSTPFNAEIGAEPTAFSYVMAYGVRELLDPYRLPAAVA